MEGWPALEALAALVRTHTPCATCSRLPCSVPGEELWLISARRSARIRRDAVRLAVWPDDAGIQLHAAVVRPDAGAQQGIALAARPPRCLATSRRLRPACLPALVVNGGLAQRRPPPHSAQRRAPGCLAARRRCARRCASGMSRKCASSAASHFLRADWRRLQPGADVWLNDKHVRRSIDTVVQWRGVRGAHIRPSAPAKCTRHGVGGSWDNGQCRRASYPGARGCVALRDTRGFTHAAPQLAPGRSSPATCVAGKAGYGVRLRWLWREHNAKPLHHLAGTPPCSAALVTGGAPLGESAPASVILTRKAQARPAGARSYRRPLAARSYIN